MPATVADAVIARLVAQVPGGVAYDPAKPATAEQVVVYDNEVPDHPGQRYLVLYCGLGIWSARTYNGQHRDNSVTFQMTTVASDQAGQQVAAQMCRWLEGKGITALLGWRPDVDGLTCSAVRHVQLDNWPARSETVVSIPTIYTVDRFTLRTRS